MSKISILNSVFSEIEKLDSAEEYKRIIKLVEKREWFYSYYYFFFFCHKYWFCIFVVLRYTPISWRVVIGSIKSRVSDSSESDWRSIQLHTEEWSITVSTLYWFFLKSYIITLKQLYLTAVTLKIIDNTLF